MSKELIDLDVSNIQNKEYIYDILNFWLHSFLLRIAKHDLDTDAIYKLAINMAKFRNRVEHNKKKVEVTSVLQASSFLNIVDAFVECNINHQNGRVNSKYIHSLAEISSILKFEEILLNLNNKLSSKYPLNSHELHVFKQTSSIMHKIISLDRNYFDKQCYGTINVHFNSY